MLAADAAVGLAPGQQVFDHFGVSAGALALAKRAFVPIEPEPAQAFDDRFFGCDRRAFSVCVFDAQHEDATVVACVGPVEERGSGASKVQEPRGAGGEARANF